MNKNIKLVDVDVLSVMKRIADAHIEHYKSDLAIDLSALRAMARDEKGRGKTYVWLCRKSGSWLLSEYNTLLRGSYEHSTCCFYDEQGMGDEILAYIIEIVGASGKKVMGNIYAMDYAAYCDHIRKESVSTDVVIYYERGEKILPIENMSVRPDGEFGKMCSWKYHPKSKDTVDASMAEAKRRRMKFSAVDVNTFLCGLADAEKKAG